MLGVALCGNGSENLVMTHELSTVSLRLLDINAEGYYAYVKIGKTTQ